MHKIATNQRTMFIEIHTEPKCIMRRIIPGTGGHFIDEVLADRITSPSAKSDKDQVYRLLTNLHSKTASRLELGLASGIRFSDSDEHAVASFNQRNGVLTLSFAGLDSYPIARTGPDFTKTATINLTSVKEICKIGAGVFVVGIIAGAGEFSDIWYVRQFSYGETVILL